MTKEEAEVRELYAKECIPGLPKWGSFDRLLVGVLLAAIDAERLRSERLAALLEGMAYDDGDVKATGEYVARRFQEVRAERDRLAALLKKVEQEVAAWGEQAPMESDDAT